ncbi:hypothetical protein ACE1CI_00420 [Aerosakkonemataceae cyanobacterium BLCC-F50]|uniref:RiboL-PSP-HEPN domain-containing protein n=1 Tax=Floridaenema flaviceps BLCC-F50 TaxID=3153642 RepID=A0ABV4XIY7_9CYAN
MDEEIKKTAVDRLARAFKEAIELYTDTALLLNACDIARKRYENIHNLPFLSTTCNIPQDYQYRIEFDLIFEPPELIQEYSEPLLKVLSLNYLVRAIALFDACLEDIYGTLLPVYDISLTVEKVTKRVLSAWTEKQNYRKSQLRCFFTDELGLKSPERYPKNTLDMLFDRYEEMREIRHAVVHNKGVLAKKHQDKLKLLSERLPEELRHLSLANADFLETNTVNMEVLQIYMIRYWLFEAISYLMISFQES